MTKTSSRFLPLLLAGAAALTLAACGSSSPSSSSGASDDEKELAFQDCLRDEGLDVTVTRGGGVGIRANSTQGGSESGPSASTDRAFETCRKRTGWAPRPPSEEQQAEFRDRALRFAQCMRSHGVDMADPTSDGRMMLRVEQGPTTDAAMRACGRFGGPASAGATAP